MKITTPKRNLQLSIAKRIGLKHRSNFQFEDNEVLDNKCIQNPLKILNKVCIDSIIKLDITLTQKENISIKDDLNYMKTIITPVVICTDIITTDAYTELIITNTMDLKILETTNKITFHSVKLIFIDENRGKIFIKGAIEKFVEYSGKKIGEQLSNVKYQMITEDINISQIINIKKTVNSNEKSSGKISIEIGEYKIYDEINIEIEFFS